MGLCLTLRCSTVNAWLPSAEVMGLSHLHSLRETKLAQPGLNFLSVSGIGVWNKALPDESSHILWNQISSVFTNFCLHLDIGWIGKFFRIYLTDVRDASHVGIKEIVFLNRPFYRNRPCFDFLGTKPISMPDVSAIPSEYLKSKFVSVGRSQSIGSDFDVL